MPISINNANTFHKYIIARSDKKAAYENWGYLAFVNEAENAAAVTNFGHNSICDTIQVTIERNLDWTGTIQDMVNLAITKEDIYISGRSTTDPLLLELYSKLREWAKDRQPVEIADLDKLTIIRIEEVGNIPEKYAAYITTDFDRIKYLAIIPKSEQGKDMPWIETGTPFGRKCTSQHHLASGEILKIGYKEL